MKNLLLILVCFLIFTPVFLAQNEDDSTNWKWDWDNGWWEWKHGKPFIELTYGIGEPKHENLISNLAKNGLAELKLGYSSFDTYDDNVIYFNDRFSFISKLATKFQSKKKAAFLSSELLRFGFGKRNGYGYDFENVRILPYTQNGIVWSKLQMKDFPAAIFPGITNDNAKDDTEILKRYNGSFRFGTLAEGGIQLEVGSVSLNVGYEATVVFPRHMVWKHLGSYAIEMIGLNALDRFIDEVLDSSPAAGPIVNFLLKNGFTYAFYTLKKEKMNWPFKTETPLTYEMMKFGVTFTF